MRTREKPLTIPDTRIYVELDVPGKGAHHFRLPRTSGAVRLLKLIPAATIKTTASVLDGAHSNMEKLEHFALVEESAALVVGELWHHATLELESDRTDGAALAEEFHEAGYSPWEVYSLCLSLYTPLGDLLFAVTEAKETTALFPETTGGVAMPS